MKHFQPIDFIRESNRIEGIFREPSGQELDEYFRFMAQDEITLADMVQFVSVYQPDARLREHKGMNVRVGNYFPPPGDITVKTRLLELLEQANKERGPDSAYRIHVAYESLHPFLDGNGRSGRMLWMWIMREAPVSGNP